MKPIAMNKFIHSSVAAALTLAASVAVSTPAQAADFDFSGTFENDNDVLLFDFEVDVDSTVTVFSSSWVNGGFDPILSLFDSAGNLIQQQDDGLNIGSTSSNGVSYNHGLWDTYFSSFLTPGSYRVGITQYDNFANGPTLADGFTYDGDGNENFTANFGCSQASFCGFPSQESETGDPNFNRTNAWEFHVLNVAQAGVVEPPVEPPTSVPEPASILGLLTIGALGISARLKRNQEV
jgi:hypothetical protein